MLVDNSNRLFVLLAHFRYLLLVNLSILLILKLSEKQIKAFLDKSNSLRVIDPLHQLAPGHINVVESLLVQLFILLQIVQMLTGLVEILFKVFRLQKVLTLLKYLSSTFTPSRSAFMLSSIYLLLSFSSGIYRHLTIDLVI